MKQEQVTDAALLKEPTKNAIDTEIRRAGEHLKLIAHKFAAYSQMMWQVAQYVNLKLPHLPTSM